MKHLPSKDQSEVPQSDVSLSSGIYFKTGEKMDKTIWLIDIDGTVCEDIPNEESHRFREAKVLPMTNQELMKVKLIVGLITKQ